MDVDNWSLITAPESESRFIGGTIFPPLALFESILTPFIVLLLNTLDVSPQSDVASDLQLSADTDGGCANDDPVDPNTANETEVPIEIQSLDKNKGFQSPVQI